MEDFVFKGGDTQKGGSKIKEGSDPLQITFRCTTFLKSLENEFKGHMCTTNDTLPNDSYHYGYQLCKYSEFEMHAFNKMTEF